MPLSVARRLTLILAGLLLLASLTAGVSLGQVPDGSVPDGAPSADDPAGAGVPDPALDKDPKMEGAIAATAHTALASGDDAALDLARARGLTVLGSSVRVIVLSADPDRSAADAAIVAAGGAVEAEYADAIQALLAPSAIAQVANDPAVRYVRAPAQSSPNSRAP